MKGFSRGLLATSEEVTTISLDAYTATHRLMPVDVIKIDVEGFEHLVLKGAVELLARQRPTVVCECLPESETDEIERLLLELKYTAFRLIDGESIPISTIQSGPTGRLQNFLFLPTELA